MVPAKSLTYPDADVSLDLVSLKAAAGAAATEAAQDWVDQMLANGWTWPAGTTGTEVPTDHIAQLVEWIIDHIEGANWVAVYANRTVGKVFGGTIPDEDVIPGQASYLAAACAWLDSAPEILTTAASRGTIRDTTLADD